MNPSLKNKVSELLVKYKFSTKDATFLADVLGEIDDRQKSSFEAKMDTLLNQKDKTDLTILMQKDKTELLERISNVKSELTERMQLDKTELLEKISDVKSELTDRINNFKSDLTRQIYVVGLIQFLAIIASLIGILNFMR